MNDSELEPVRPGEDSIPEIREGKPFPLDDKERMEFRSAFANLLDDTDDIPKAIMDDIMILSNMHHSEMMTRRSHEISLSNRQIVHEGFQKNLPQLCLDDLVLSPVADLTQKESDRRFLEPTDANMVNYKRVFKEFDVVRDKLIVAITKATEHFNRSCKLLEMIETIAEDKTKTETQRVQEGQVLMKDLIALHKGTQGTARRHY